VAQPEDERSWVEIARTGDPSERSDAVGRLYERYFDRIYKYVNLKIGDSTEAEDLTEQVFVKMLEAIGSFRWQGSSFASWLFRIAHNQVVDHVRQRARRPQVSLDPIGAYLPAENYDPHLWAEQSDFRDHLRESLTQLTGLQAEVISLKFAAGLSNSEIAVVMHRTEGAVKSLQYSALQNLNRLMTLRGYGVVLVDKIELKIDDQST
jgi:RNA polymerase sigma-70 factor (ECF subfamily)